MTRSSQILLVLGVLLAGCSLAPMPRIYILGGPAAKNDDRPGRGLPVLEVRTVSVPSYLDSTDILRRHGANELVASPTGRWGERLSYGVTDALARALSQQRPDLVIDTSQRTSAQFRLFVEISQFDINEDGKCRLSAHWRTTAGDGAPLFAGDETSITVVAETPDDAGVAAAMSAAVDRLAVQMAPTL